MDSLGKLNILLYCCILLGLLLLVIEEKRQYGSVREPCNVRSAKRGAMRKDSLRANLSTARLVSVPYRLGLTASESGSSACRGGMEEGKILSPLEDDTMSILDNSISR